MRDVVREVLAEAVSRRRALRSEKVADDLVTRPYRPLGRPRDRERIRSGLQLADAQRVVAVTGLQRRVPRLEGLLLAC